MQHEVTQQQVVQQQVVQQQDMIVNVGFLYDNLLSHRFDISVKILTSSSKLENNKIIELYGLTLEFRLELSQCALQKNPHNIFDNIKEIIEALRIMANLGHIGANLTVMAIINALIVEKNYTNLDINLIKSIIDNDSIKQFGSTVFQCLMTMPSVSFLNTCTDMVSQIVDYFSNKIEDITKFKHMYKLLKILKERIEINDKCITIWPPRLEKPIIQIALKEGQKFLSLNGDICGNNCITNKMEITTKILKDGLFYIGKFFNPTIYTKYINTKLMEDNDALLPAPETTFYGTNNFDHYKIHLLNIFEKIIQNNIILIINKQPIDEKNKDIDNNNKTEINVNNNNSNDNTTNKKQSNQHKQNTSTLGENTVDDNVREISSDGKPEEIAKIIEKIFKSLHTYTEETYAEKAKHHEEDQDNEVAVTTINEKIKKGEQVYNYILTIPSHKIDKSFLQIDLHLENPKTFFLYEGKIANGFTIYKSYYNNVGEVQYFDQEDHNILT